MTRALWDRYREYLTVHPSIELRFDTSRMKFSGDFLAKMEPAMQKAFAAMDALEAGAIANPDEKRMVGHYWLRDAGARADAGDRARRSTTRSRASSASPPTCTARRVRGEQAATFMNLLVIGIGGSALGPEFVADGARRPGDDMMRCTSSTTPIPTAWTACSRGSTASSTRR